MAVLRACYIGEEPTATGFALAGVAAHVVAEQDDGLKNLFERCYSECDVVFVNHAHARALGAVLNDKLLQQPVPPVLVIPSLATDEEGAAGALLGEARRVLGLDAGQSRPGNG